eukprot:GAHX01001521.1.p1 GENE.GAHX01001521.1~~GAHX01001521.1.p1  ORF type:complete len:280 (-),score=49.96 GAHX01001521.1:33-872(-)
MGNRKTASGYYRIASSDNINVENYKLINQNFTQGEKKFLKGNKVYLPSSILRNLNHEYIKYPLVFSIVNLNNGRKTCCGVAEFTAPEGCCILTPSILKTLKTSCGDFVAIDYTEIRRANFVTLKPYKNQFYEIDDPKRFLEKEISAFLCLQKGDVLSLKNGDVIHDFLITQLKPFERGLICNVDLKVDFESSFENDRKTVVDKLPEIRSPNTSYKLTDNISTQTTTPQIIPMDEIITEEDDEFVFYYKINENGEKKLFKRESKAEIESRESRGKSYSLK